MGLRGSVKRLVAGYPSGWKRYARGTSGNTTPPYIPPTDPDDYRSLIPPLGLREYWYPALPAKDVGGKKPVGLRICGIDLVFFRDTQGAVQALWDYCPHRGAYLSWGDCFWKGYVSCPYHGATFDGQGECVEFITEGPESKMPGRLKARKFPTVTLKGIVFVWMGEGEPAPIEEDVPPEFFEDNPQLVVLYTIRYWHCNWMIALENTSDAHNCFWVHRDSLFQLRSRTGGRPRTPVGYRTEFVNDRAAIVIDSSRYRDGNRVSPGAASYYADKDGKLPYQMYYPRIDGYWPLHRWRLLWAWLFEIFDRRNARKPRFETPQEWGGGMHLPSMQRLFFGGPGCMYTRWCVPVEENLTRVVYFRSRRIPTRLGRFYERLAFKLYRNWLIHYNFSDQDYDAMRSVRAQYPEYLSATDSHLVAERRLIIEHARGLQRRITKVTPAEELVTEAHELLSRQAPTVSRQRGS